MKSHHIDDMLHRLKPVLKDQNKARVILKRYWRTRMALVWMIEDVHRAANELEVALTNCEAMDVLQSLLNHHNAQYGIKWEDLTAHIEAHVLGRKLTRREVNEFVQNDKLTIQR